MNGLDLQDAGPGGSSAATARHRSQHCIRPAGADYAVSATGWIRQMNAILTELH